MSVFSVMGVAETQTCCSKLTDFCTGQCMVVEGHKPPRFAGDRPSLSYAVMSMRIAQYIKMCLCNTGGFS